MPFLAEFLTVVVIHLLAVMSPGPDFAMVIRNSLLHSRQAGIFSALGLGLGILVHVTYSLVGIGFVISQSLLLFSVLKFAGAAYLIYIGWKSLMAKPLTEVESLQKEVQAMGKFAALRMGFLTNILNPKVTLFFLALFTQVISPATPKAIQVLYGLEMSVMTVLWFTVVASILSLPAVRIRFAKIHGQLERVFGVLLIALGLKVALSAK